MGENNICKSECHSLNITYLDNSVIHCDPQVVFFVCTGSCEEGLPLLQKEL